MRGGVGRGGVWSKCVGVWVGLWGVGEWEGRRVCTCFACAAAAPGSEEAGRGRCKRQHAAPLPSSLACACLLRGPGEQPAKARGAGSHCFIVCTKALTFGKAASHSGYMSVRLRAGGRGGKGQVSTAGR